MLSKPKGVRRDYVTYVHEATAPELTPEEEEVLARCSVFRESFPPEALAERPFQLSEMKLSAGEKSEAMKLKEEGFRILNGKPRR